MNSRKFTAALVLFTALALTTVGCTDWKQEYDELQGQYAELNAEHNALLQNTQGMRTDLSRCEAQRNQLQNQLNSVRGDLTDARRERDKWKEIAQGIPDGPTGDSTTRVPGEVTVITLESDVLFGAGSAKLTAAGQRAIGSVLPQLRGKYAGMTVRIYGHTDSDPIVKTKKLWQDNLDLSANRAMAVTRYLRERGIDGARIETIAMGQTQPVASNKTKTGKAKNRRVTIGVVR